MRELKDRFMAFSSLVAMILALIPILSLLAVTLVEGAWRISPSFLINEPAPPGQGGGIGNAIQGTFMMIVVAAALGISVGICSGIYMAEYSQKSHILEIFTDVMAGVPSIILGLVVFLILVRFIGFSALAGGVALSLIMIPIVARSTEEALKEVPNDVREAAAALGIPKWKTILYINLRAAEDGIKSGLLLSTARALGEAAPLLFTAFGSQFYSGINLLQPASSMSLVIYTYGSSPWQDWRGMAWGTALLLLLITAFMSVFSRRRSR
ncbi:MAG: phosphate ABC transporter permease PstA [Candidatus Methanodesulfokora sp.]|jgi:phosphate transport system permease protein